ncbi:unnamed protein product [Sphagnum balticum]
MPDNRIVAVQSFLDARRCGSQTSDFDAATEFVDEADTYHIDWRILPVIYLKESTCGQHELAGTNNGFGFGNGSVRFTSFANAVATISEKLTIHPYAGKSLQGIISTYNNHPEYLTSFMGYYQEITLNYEAVNRLLPMLNQGVIQGQ